MVVVVVVVVGAGNVNFKRVFILTEAETDTETRSKWFVCNWKIVHTDRDPFTIKFHRISMGLLSMNEP